jgi:hypothetical protein
MLGGVLVMIGFMVLRNYVVTGGPSAPVFTVTGHWVRPASRPMRDWSNRAGQWWPTSGAEYST